MSATVFDEAWELTPADRLLVEAKRWGGRLRFAVMLLFYRARGRFPRAAAEVDGGAVAELARTLGVPTPRDPAALLPEAADRTLERQRAKFARPVQDPAPDRGRVVQLAPDDAQQKCHERRAEPLTAGSLLSERIPHRGLPGAYAPVTHHRPRARSGPLRPVGLNSLPLSWL